MLSSHFAKKDNDDEVDKDKSNKIFDKIALHLDNNDLHKLIKLINEKLSHRDLMKLKISAYTHHVDNPDDQKEHVLKFVLPEYQTPELLDEIIEVSKSNPDIRGSGFGKFFKKVSKGVKKAVKKIDKTRKKVGHMTDGVRHSKLFKAYGNFVDLGSSVVGTIGAVTAQPELEAAAALMKAEARVLKEASK